MKKTLLTVLAACLLLTLLLPCPTRADGGLAVTGSSVETEFPMALDFGLTAESGLDITDVRLHYQVERIEFAEITQEIYIGFMPDTSIEVNYEWDMRKTGGLPPGSSVTYWWTVTDAGGSKIVTEPATIGIEDDNHEWQSLTWEQVTIYWYRGDEDFAGELMATTQEVLARLTEDTGVSLEQPIKLFMYGNASDLRNSMIFPQEWTGGVAFTRYGIIAIGVNPDNLEWGKFAIAHELTHLVVHQATFSPYGGLPTWLDEGLAMRSEGELDAAFQNILENAYKAGELISVQSLASPFSAYADESSLGYAQSYSLVDYLIVKYGQAKMFELLNTFERGSGYDEALYAVYGFDMDGLDELWRQYLADELAGQ